MPFEWDLVKASTNEDKHGVSFEEAASIFRGFCVHQRDTRQDYGEPRFVALGLDSNGVLLNVVYTPRDDNIRIISAWKASRHEREAYTKAQQSNRSV
jgi:uncharacterized DUF497 family protein